MQTAAMIPGIKANVSKDLGLRFMHKDAIHWVVCMSNKAVLI